MFFVAVLCFVVTYVKGCHFIAHRARHCEAFRKMKKVSLIHENTSNHQGLTQDIANCEILNRYPHVRTLIAKAHEKTDRKTEIIICGTSGGVCTKHRSLIIDYYVLYMRHGCSKEYNLGICAL